MKFHHKNNRCYDFQLDGTKIGIKKFMVKLVKTLSFLLSVLFIAVRLASTSYVSL